MSARWIDLVDPTRDEVLASVTSRVDPEVVDLLASPGHPGREPWPVLEGHGSYVFGVLVALRPVETGDGLVEHQELDFVATPDLLVTVRKGSRSGRSFEAVGLQHAAQEDVPVGVLVHRLVDDVAETYLQLLDEIYVEIDQLEDRLDVLPSSEARVRMADLRHHLLHSRRTVSATRAAVRRVLDGRVDVGAHELFPPAIERRFADTYDTLVRVTEDLDVARDLLASVRDHLQAKVAETQNDVAKKLTVIASLVLVPSLVVGFFGQNFQGEFDKGFWTLGFSTGLILVSTAVQLALFRWRRWI